VITIEDGFYEREGFTLAAGFTIARGSFVAVLGPSGSGKSTLLSLIAGFETLNRGRILLDGNDMSEIAPGDRSLSIMFQDHNSFAHLDAWTNVALGISPALKLDGRQRAAVDGALARVGLAELAKRLPGEMSGGERQRIALARILVRKRPVLLLDEPFAALGPGLRRDMLNLVKELQSEHGLTVLLVTHQPEEARRAADQVLFVADGLVRGPMATQDFFDAKDDPAILTYLGDWSLPT
jgi:thiamine transport system ATP-binding protein